VVGMSDSPVDVHRLSNEIDPVYLLQKMSLVAPGEIPDLVELSRGVSSDIWRVTTPSRTFVLKRARQQLQVDGEWFAPVERGAAEVEWLSVVSQMLPENVPDVLGFDPEDFGIARPQ
jgi:hypothetical protein